MNSTAVPRLACRSRISSRIWACGDVQRGGGLVGDQQRRLQHQRAGDHDALALAAGQASGIAGGDALGIRQPHVAQRPGCGRACRRATGRCASSASSSWSPMRITGLSADIGSGRSCRCGCRAARAIARPGPAGRGPEQDGAGHRRHHGCGSRPMTALAIMDLPEPLSPTMHSVSPRPMRRLASLTASGRSAPAGRRIDRPRMSSRASPDGGAAAWEVTRFMRAAPGIHAGVQPVAQAFADQVQRQHRQQDGYAGEQADPPGLAQRGAGRADHVAPAHHVGIAQAHEAQARFQQDGRGYHQRHHHDGAAALGRIWVTMMRRFDSPARCAAWTKSRWRSVRNCCAPAAPPAATRPARWP